MSKSQRTKGANGEREAASLLRSVFPNARRRSSGEESQTLVGADLAGVEPLVVQVKVGAMPQPLAALAQAMMATRGDGDLPVALVRQSSRSKSGSWVAVLRATDFLLLLRGAGYGGTDEPSTGDVGATTRATSDRRGPA